MGNRTAQTVGGTTTSFTINSDDELTAPSGGFTNSYSYNSNGEQTGRTLSGTAWTLAYDYEGQLTSTATGGSTVSSFAYDALGRRYSRTNGGTTTRFYYGPGGVLCEKAGGSFTAAYAYGNGLIRKDGEYPLFDGLGSQRTVTNGSQTVTATAIYEGFGSTIASTGSSGSAYGFAATSGYRNDGDAGLMHVGARYYDAQVGRFITRDTYLDQHPYLYCEHDPINRIDPSGHGWLSTILSGVGAAVGTYFGGPGLGTGIGGGVGTFVGDLLEGGNWKDALKDGLASGALWGIGTGWIKPIGGAGGGLIKPPYWRIPDAAKLRIGGSLIGPFK